MDEHEPARGWRAVGRLLSRRTAATLGIALVVTAVAAIGLAQLEFETGQNSYIDPASQAAADNERYQALFGGESMVVLFTMDEGSTVADLFTPANVAQLREVEAELLRSDAVSAVVSPLTLLQWTQNLVAEGVASAIIGRTIERETDAAAAALRQDDALITVQRVGAAGEQTFDNPEWVNFLLFGNDGFSVGSDGRLVSPPRDQLVVRRALRAFIPDPHHAVFAAILVGNAPLDDLADGSAAVHDVLAERDFEHATVTITGTPTFLTDINEYLQGGMFTLGAIAVVVMVVILLVAFRIRWRLLPLVGMAFGVTWGFGAFGFTGTSLSLVTIAGLPILIGLGIEFAIQIQNRVEEERTADPGDDRFGTTLVHLGPPLVAATVAACIAFLTVKLSKVPMVQDFGVLLAIGIVALLAAGIVLPITVIGARERRRPTTRDPEETWVEAVVHRLGSVPRAAVLPLVVVAVALPIVGLVLEDGSRIESDPINWANQSSTSIRNARLLERETGFATTLGVFVETSGARANGTFTDQTGAFLLDLVERSLAENGELAEASSLATTVAWLTEVPGTTQLPPTGLDMLQAYGVAPAALQELLVAEDGNATQVLFQVGPSSLEARAEVLDRVHAAIADPGDGALLPVGATATTGGLAVVGVGLLENITANRAQLTIAALLLVGAFVVLRSRDLARGLLTMVPVLLAVGTSATLVRVLGITLSPLTTVGGPLVVATCAEFSVLLVARYAEERQRGLDPDASTRVAARRTGRAFFTSALTTLGGFAVLMFSSLPLLADFGMVVTINIAVALLSALVVVPPLVKEADRRGLLAMDATTSGDAPRWRPLVGWAGGAAIALVGVSLVVVTAQDDEAAAAAPRRTEVAEAPATVPTTTTTSIPPTTSTVDVPSESIPSSESTPPTGDGDVATTVVETTIAVTTLPAGAPERPSGLVAGAFWDALTAVGVDPGVARCAADDLLATTSEADLLAMGIASVPRPAEVDALLAAAGTRCGVTQDQLDAAGGA